MGGFSDNQGKGRDRSGQNRYPAGFAEALGRTVKVLRTDMGLSRKELAAQADISYSGLTAIENGNNPPSSSLLVPIAAALGVRPSYLLELAERRMDSQADDYLETSLQAQESLSSAPPAPAAASPEQAWSERFASTERRDRGLRFSETSRDASARHYLRMDHEAPSRGPDLGPKSGIDLAAARELAYLVERMAPDDIQRLLDYARRLSR